MKTTSPKSASQLSRREALRRTLLGGFALAGAAALPQAGAAPAPAPFVPENDYPFFGCEPGETAANRPRR